MNEKDEMTDLIRASLDGIRDVASSSTVIGNAILTPSGVTVIPVSRVSCGFLTGGVDLYPKKSDKPQNFGGGGGSGTVGVSSTSYDSTKAARLRDTRLRMDSAARNEAARISRP